jgi:hypothetical protein
MVPPHLRAELLKKGKKQRNTQAELLAIWCILLTEAEKLRGNVLYIADDSTATKGNMLRQTAKSEDSRSIVGNIWLLAALLNVQISINHVPGCLNPGDPFSRPEDQKKQEQSARLAEFTAAKGLDMKWPPGLKTAPAEWGKAIQEARKMSKTENPLGVRDKKGGTKNKAVFQNAVLLWPTDTATIVDLVGSMWTMPRFIAGYARSKTTTPMAQQSVTMRNACRYSQIIGPIVNAARQRAGIEHVELLTKVSTQETENLSLRKGQGALTVQKGKAKWWRCDNEGNTQAVSEEDVHFETDFRLVLGTATHAPTGKARQQLRNWGFNPRVVLEGPFNTFGKREDISSNGSRDVTVDLSTASHQTAQERQEKNHQPWE